jgi:hypothetical protein
LEDDDMVALLAFLEKRPLVFPLAFSAIPCAELRFNLSRVMHAEPAMAAAPSAAFLVTLLGIGAVVPAAFLAVVVHRLVRESSSFELGALLEVYASLLLVFAVTYAVLQVSSVEPAFAGMSTVWDSRGASSVEHLARFHEVFGNSLYLSAITMTTVGFGDILPIGAIAKTLTALQGILGIGFVGLVLGQYFSSCVACESDEA